jgi:hypothetical protein
MAGKGETINSKSEIRRPKAETNLKFEFQKFPAGDFENQSAGPLMLFRRTASLSRIQHSGRESAITPQRMVLA